MTVILVIKNAETKPPAQPPNPSATVHGTTDIPRNKDELKPSPRAWWPGVKGPRNPNTRTRVSGGVEDGGAISPPTHWQ